MKRQSLDSSQTAAEGFKAGVDPEAEAKEREDREEPAVVEAIEGASAEETDKYQGNDTVRINPFDHDSGDSGFDLFDGDALGAQTSLPRNFGDASVLEGEEGEGDEEEEEEEEDSGTSQNEGASGATVGGRKNATASANSDPPVARHPNDGGEGNDSNNSSPPKLAARKLLGGQAEAGAGAGETAGNKSFGLGLAQKSADGDAAAEDDFGTLGATAALTPDSIGPVPFSLESAVPRSRVDSSSSNSSISTSEPASSTAPASSLPNTARVERKVSRIAGLLRRLSSRETSDPANALRLEALDFDSDDEYGA